MKRRVEIFSKDQGTYQCLEIFRRICPGSDGDIETSQILQQNLLLEEPNNTEFTKTMSTNNNNNPSIEDVYMDLGDPIFHLLIYRTMSSEDPPTDTEQTSDNVPLGCTNDDNNSEATAMDTRSSPRELKPRPILARRDAITENSMEISLETETTATESQQKCIENMNFPNEFVMPQTVNNYANEDLECIIRELQQSPGFPQSTSGPLLQRNLDQPVAIFTSQNSVPTHTEVPKEYSPPISTPRPILSRNYSNEIPTLENPTTNYIPNYDLTESSPEHIIPNPTGNFKPCTKYISETPKQIESKRDLHYTDLSLPRTAPEPLPSTQQCPKYSALPFPANSEIHSSQMQKASISTARYIDKNETEDLLTGHNSMWYENFDEEFSIPLAAIRPTVNEVSPPFIAETPTMDQCFTPDPNTMLGSMQMNRSEIENVTDQNNNRESSTLQGAMRSILNEHRLNELSAPRDSTSGQNFALEYTFPNTESSAPYARSRHETLYNRNLNEERSTLNNAYGISQVPTPEDSRFHQILRTYPNEDATLPHAPRPILNRLNRSEIENPGMDQNRILYDRNPYEGPSHLSSIVSSGHRTNSATGQNFIPDNMYPQAESSLANTRPRPRQNLNERWNYYEEYSMSHSTLRSTLDNVQDTEMDQNPYRMNPYEESSVPNAALRPILNRYSTNEREMGENVMSNDNPQSLPHTTSRSNLRAGYNVEYGMENLARNPHLVTEYMNYLDEFSTSLQTLRSFIFRNEFPAPRVPEYSTVDQNVLLDQSNSESLYHEPVRHSINEDNVMDQDPAMNYRYRGRQFLRNRDYMNVNIEAEMAQALPRDRYFDEPRNAARGNECYLINESGSSWRRTTLESTMQNGHSERHGHCVEEFPASNESQNPRRRQINSERHGHYVEEFPASYQLQNLPRGQINPERNHTNSYADRVLPYINPRLARSNLEDDRNIPFVHYRNPCTDFLVPRNLSEAANINRRTEEPSVLNRINPDAIPQNIPRPVVSNDYNNNEILPANGFANPIREEIINVDSDLSETSDLSELS